MALCVFCNNCFQQPKANGCKFALSNCGHVICEICLRKGSVDICCVCKARCHTVFLSDKMDPDLKALFTQPDKVCERYLKMFLQIMEFQEKHRRHLCAKEIEEHSKLKAYAEHITQKKEQLQRELAEHKNYITKLENTFQQRQQTPRLSTPATSREFVSTPSMKSTMYSSLPQSRPSTTERAHKVELNGKPSPLGKSDLSMGPPRLSVITPPQDGRMGTVPYRGVGKIGSFRLAPHSAMMQHVGLPGSQSSGSMSHRGGSWDTFSNRSMLSYPSVPSLSQTPTLRAPITISDLLMRP